MSGFSMSLDLTAFTQVIEQDKAAIAAASRPAAQAGAEVLYQAVLQNVRGLGRKTGRLAASIYQAYSPENSKGGRHQYNVSWRTGRMLDKNGKPIASGLPTAPHGHLVEWGYIQKYLTYQAADGRIRPVVKPSMRGKPRPKNAAEKDAYYVPRPGGPVHIPGKAFVRRAVDQFPKAQQAMQDELFERLKAAGVIK